LTFLEMLERAYWAIDDTYTTHANIAVADMKLIINEGLQDLAPAINYITSATLTLTSEASALPADFLEPLRLEWATDEDDEIPQIYDLDEKENFYESFFIGGYTTLTIFTDATVADGTQIKLWYKAKPAVLSADTDTPSTLPTRFHHFIPEVYVKSIWALRNDKLNTYSGLMSVWEGVRAEVNRDTSISRNRVANFTKKQVW